MKKLLEQLSEQAVQIENHNFSDEEIINKYIGKQPATADDIDNAEKRLGIKLPTDVKEFYLTSNGTSIILNQTFGGFEPIEKIDWLKNVDANLIECFAGITAELTDGLNNSIIIAGHNYCHNMLIIQPFGKYKKWRYWEFASYVPGETPFKGIKKYLERLNDFLFEQNKKREETLSK